MGYLKTILVLGILGFTSLTMFTLAWDNDNFIDDSFWAEYDGLSTQLEKDVLIVGALYGDGNGNTDRTAYSEPRSSISCNTASMNVIVVANGAIIPSISSNSIYVLEGNSYIRSSAISISSRQCVTIIGKERASLYSSVVLGGSPFISIGGGTHIILDNLEVHGVKNGVGGTHAASMGTVWFYTSSNNSTTHGIHSEGASFAFLGNFYMSAHTAKDSNHLNRNHTASNGLIIDGFSGNNGNLNLYNVSNAIMNNITISNGGEMYLSNLSNSTGTNIKILNANHIYRSISINNGSTDNYFEDIELYGGVIGLEITSNATYNTINNLLSYNHTDRGVKIFGAANNSINNAQIFNNGNVGIELSDRLNGGSLLENAVNNTQIYNNGIGLLLNDSSYNILHDIQIYNNTEGLKEITSTISTNNTYYGELKIFGNGTDLSMDHTSPIITGTDGLLGRSNGILSQPSEPISFHNVLVPQNSMETYLYDKNSPSLGWIGVFAWDETIDVEYDKGQYIYLNVSPIGFSGNDVIVIDRPTESLIECFQSENVSYLEEGSICLGIQEANIVNRFRITTIYQRAMKVAYNNAELSL